MNVCFLLHFYQPSNQFGDVVKKISTESYLPLIKLLKSNKKFAITANFPLSLLEQLDLYGYSHQLAELKDLVTNGRVELVGSGAYHPLLTKIPEDFVEKQVILNEMSLSYYFGSAKDFEGEDCFMVKNIRGFFPPEMAVNEALVTQLGDLGYEWVVLDEYALPDEIREKHRSGMSYTVNNQPVKLIVRDRNLTNSISFKRDLDRQTVMDQITSSDGDKVIALDAETFGHHFKEGIYFLESLVSELHEKGIRISTVSEAFANTESRDIPRVEESTWSTSDYSSRYPLWVNPSNDLNTAMWRLFHSVHSEYSKNVPDISIIDEHCVPIWKQRKQPLMTFLNFMKAEQSDQFWWSTGTEAMGKLKYSKYMVSSVLDLYKEVIQTLDNKEELLQIVSEIQGMLVEDSKQ